MDLLMLKLRLIVFCTRCASCALDVSMRKICARFSQCAIYAQDLHKIVLIFSMRNIMHKIVLISPMRNICATYAQHLRKSTSFSNVQYMHKICARLYLFLQCTRYAQDLRKMYLFLQCAIYVQDLHKIVLIFSMCNIRARFAQDCTSFSMRNICARFVQDCTSFPNAQYMRKICARLYFFPQCAIFAQDLCKIVLLSPMRNICARLYFFLQCAIYVQDLRKIVLLSPTCNICPRFAQDCTSLPNVQYLHKIAGIIGRNMSHITYLLQNLEWYSLHCHFWIATSSDFFLNKHL